MFGLFSCCNGKTRFKCCGDTIKTVDSCAPTGSIEENKGLFSKATEKDLLLPQGEENESKTGCFSALFCCLWGGKNTSAESSPQTPQATPPQAGYGAAADTIVPPPFIQPSPVATHSSKPFDPATAVESQVSSSSASSNPSAEPPKEAPITTVSETSSAPSCTR